MLRGFGQAATTDTTAVIRPPQNNPEERGRTEALRVSVSPGNNPQSSSEVHTTPFPPCFSS